MRAEADSAAGGCFRWSLLLLLASSAEPFSTRTCCFLGGEIGSCRELPEEAAYGLHKWLPGELWILVTVRVGEVASTVICCFLVGETVSCWDLLVDTAYGLHSWLWIRLVGGEDTVGGFCCLFSGEEAAYGLENWTFEVWICGLVGDDTVGGLCCFLGGAETAYGLNNWMLPGKLWAFVVVGKDGGELLLSWCDAGCSLGLCSD